MNEQGWFARFCKFFGLIYLGVNVIILVVLGSMMIYTANDDTPFSQPWIYLGFPVIGMVAGYWIRKCNFEWWRIPFIVLSLLCSAALLFVIFVAGPQMQEMEQEKFKLWEAAQQESVQRMLDAVTAGDMTITTEQLNDGVDVNAVNESGQTALHLVQSADITRLLIERGSDINAKDDMGMTPVFNKEIEIAGILLDAGADINARSEKGNTPFVWYTYSGYLDGLRFLVSRGADVSTCNADNQSSLDIAEHFHPNTDVLEYLQTLNIQSCNE